MSPVGAIHVDVKANTKPFESGMSGLGGIAKKIGGVIAAALVSKAAVDFGKQCIGLASDLNEVQNVVDVTFSHMSGKMDEWAQGAATQFGLSETMAKRYAGTFGSMAEAFGFTEAQAYDMSTALTGLAGDVASFYNISQDEAYGKLKSVFSGETESLKSLGVVMTQSALDEYALANGFGKVTSAMSEQEKVSLRLAFVQSALSNASGDFSRTSGGWANQIRLLSLQFESFKATLGQSMIAALLPVVRGLNAIMSAAIGAARAFNLFIQTITGKSMAMLTGGATQAGAAIADTASEASDAGTSLGGLTNAQNAAAKSAGAQEKAQKALNRALAGFDKINRLSSDSTSTGGGSAGGVGGGGGGVDSLGGFGGAVAEEAGQAQKALEKLKLPESLLGAIEHAKTAFGTFASTIKSAVGWVWDNILKPLGKWTMNQLAPRVVEVLASAFDVLNAVIGALKPVWDALWQYVVKPFAQFIGNRLLTVLDNLDTVLDILAEAISRHVAPVIKALCDFFSKTLGPVIQRVITFIDNGLVVAFGALRTAATWLWKNVLAPLGDFLVGQFAISCYTVANRVAPRVADALDAIKAIGTWVWKKVLVPFGKFLSGAFSAGVKAGTKVIDAFKTAWNGVKTAAQWVWDHLLKPIADFLKGNFGDAVEGASGALDGVAEAWGGAKEFAASLVLKPAQTVADVAGWCAERVAKWVGKESPLSFVLKTAASTVGGWFSTVSAAWTSKESPLSFVTGTLATTVSSWWSDTTAGWKDKAAKLTAGLGTTASGVNDMRKKVSGWWTKPLTKLLGLKAERQTTSKKVSEERQNISDWWSKNPLSRKLGIFAERKTTQKNVNDERSNISDWWSKNPLARKLGMSAESTTSASTVSKWRDNLQKQWYGKTATLTMRAEVTGVRKISIKPGKEGVNDIYSVTPEYFAQGGWVARNTPRLAVIGDNRREGEIVSPESKFQSMLDKAAAGTDAAALLPVLNEILTAIQAQDRGIYLDGQAITHAVVSNVNAQTRATGRSAIIV